MTARPHWTSRPRRVPLTGGDGCPAQGSGLLHRADSVTVRDTDVRPGQEVCCRVRVTDPTGHRVTSVRPTVLVGG